MLRRVLVAAAACAAVLLAAQGASARFAGGGHAIGFGPHRGFVPFRAHARFDFPGQRGVAFGSRRFPILLLPPYWGDWPYAGALGYPDVGSDAAAAVPFWQTMMEQPPCRVGLDTHNVAAEGGGTRAVTVTRCVAATGQSRGPYNSDTLSDRSDDAAVATGSIATEKTGDVGDAPGCHADTHAVPAEGGGERRITITRC